MIRYGWVIRDNTICQGMVLADWATVNIDGKEVEYPDLGTLKDKAKELLELRINHLESRIEEVDGCDEPRCEGDGNEDGDEVEEILGHAHDEQSYWLDHMAIEGEGPDAVVTFRSDEYEGDETLRQLWVRSGRNGGEERLVWPPPEGAA